MSGMCGTLSEPPVTRERKKGTKPLRLNITFLHEVDLD